MQPLRRKGPLSRETFSRHSSTTRFEMSSACLRYSSKTCRAARVAASVKNSCLPIRLNVVAVALVVIYSSYLPTPKDSRMANISISMW